MDAVAALLTRANDEHLRVFPPAVAEAYARELRDVRSRLPIGDVYVALAGEVLVGSVTLIRHSGDDTHPWPPGGAVLRLLAVEPAQRRAGWGQLLAAHCIEEAARRGRAFLALHTSPAMASAKRLYERLGFERAPLHDFRPEEHYGGVVDASEASWGEAYMLHFS